MTILTAFLSGFALGILLALAALEVMYRRIGK